MARVGKIGRMSASVNRGSAGSAGPPPTDANFATVVLLAGWNGANNAQTYTEESQYGRIATMTGTSVIGTAAKKFGTAALYHQSSGVTTFPNSGDFAFGNMFTIEFFVGIHDTSAGALLSFNAETGNQRSWEIYCVDGTTYCTLGFRASTDGATYQVDITNATAPYQMVDDDGASFHFVSVGRDASNVIRLHIDGVLAASTTQSGAFFASNTNKLVFGDRSDSLSTTTLKHFDEVRITNSVCRYPSDATYAVPSSAFPRLDVTTFTQNAPTVAIVGSRGMSPAESNVVLGSSFDKSEFRVRHRIGRFPATKLRPLFVSHVQGANGASWFRQPQNLTIKWALDTGATNWKLGDQVVLPATGKVVPTTQVVAADLSIGSIGAGANVQCRGEVVLGTSDSVYGAQARSLTTAGVAENVLSSLAQSSQTNQAGDLATASRTALAYGFSAQAILGEWVSSRDLSVLLLGDSIMFGSGDGSSASTNLGEGLIGGGFGARGLYAVGGAAKTVPWAKLAFGGQRIQRANEAIAKSIIGNYAPYATDVICNYFYNDRQSGSRLTSEILADMLQLGRFINSLGLRFHWCTPVPATSSTDAYATLANQTVNAGYASDAAAVTAGMAAYFASAYANGGIQGGVINTRSAWADAVETDKWVVNGTANYACFTDNVHPSATGHTLAGAVVSTYVNALSIP